MGDTITITDANGIVRIVGVMSDPGATPTDVLTIDADEEVSAQAGGGGGGALSQALGSFSTANNYIDPTYVAQFQLDPVALTGAFKFQITTVPMAVAMGGVVVDFSGAGLLDVAGLPVSVDAFDLSATCVVSDLTGAQILRMDPVTTVLPAGTASGHIDLAGAGHTAIAGMDLVFAEVAGAVTITSTAGGVYAAAFSIFGTYD